MNLNKIKSIHFTGIKGVGMTALALCAQDLKIKISGSDLQDVFPTDKILKQRKIKVKHNFSPKNLPKKLDLLIYTGAHHGSQNSEVIAAKKRQISVLSHARALALFSQGKKVIAVSGVGGKTTTSAMLSVILDSAGFQPSFAVGVGNISSLKTPARFIKKSSYFVAEADEYATDINVDMTPRFHYLDPYIAIITNLEHDHPDIYPDLQAVKLAFSVFISHLPPNGAVIANIDNPNLKQWIKTLDLPITTYGFSPQADWQIVKSHVADKKQFFNLVHKQIKWPEFILNVPGDYNISNAVAAIAAAYQLGVTPVKIQAGIKQFTGTKRRFEYINTVKGIDLYDDYAHHPLEIQALLKAARVWLPHKRIIVIFQPHTFSRTKALLSSFSQSFHQADLVLINSIFSSARETDNLGLTPTSLTQAVKNHQSQTFYCPGKTQTIRYLVDHCRKNDVIITLGAGDNWLWHKDIIKALKNR